MPTSRFVPAVFGVLATTLSLAGPAWSDEPAPSSDKTSASDTPAGQIVAHMDALAKEKTAQSDGRITIDGQTIDYTSRTGTLTLHGSGDQEAVPTARLFYVAYFKKGADPGKRPITFIYNGGPGSASMWLHMGAFGPKRVITRDDAHTPAAPYTLADNPDSLLDASDLVFVDAPGTGFSRLIAETPQDGDRDALMKKRKKHFYSVDGDADAFAQFITRFITRYDRWNSPKYLFGESYGTTRSAILANQLAREDNIDLNGVILLSQILNFDLSIDGPEDNPGQPLPYALALPSYAATAWYHDKLPGPKPARLKPFLDRVENFATGPYLDALVAGNTLADDRKQKIAAQLHEFTGLPVDYWKKADLRVNGAEFEKNLLADANDTTGRLDTRFAGPSLDPLSQGAQYDPQSAGLSSAYVATFNSYVRNTLNYHADMAYRPVTGLWNDWDFSHQPPGAAKPSQGPVNVMPDLATALKINPGLKVMLNVGYYDLATPFFTALYEMHHLPIPKRLADNISYHGYASGHMVYAHKPALDKLHANVAAFIEQTDRVTDDAADRPQNGKKTPAPEH
ncbi:S10 family peptidase [Salinisphaera sp. Q1T1-3]|uniref:S10 family peptidase n=1 Tax=Salinisphaera sp. Q1T1-3 TaxID=2321229 RepID=UPI000E76F7C3|nr:peptidase S10 [Salinisphaera sp. Q1T1-3]RJS93277.1 peptidase S10 [Salinisphaera sp. Q1T1-3]